MRQRNHDRPIAKAMTDTIFETALSKKTGDRHLTDKDHHLWFRKT